MKFHFIFTLFILSCSHAIPFEKRGPAAFSAVEPLHVTGSEEFLPLSPFQCPAGTKLVFGEVDVQVEHCLRDYIHSDKTHGVKREKICFAMGTRHESRLRIPVLNKIYGAVIRNIYYPMPLQNVYVALNLNHAFYSIEVVGENLVQWSSKDIKKIMRETPLPRKVRLERCECDVKENTSEECMRRIEPMLQLRLPYMIDGGV